MSRHHVNCVKQTRTAQTPATSEDAELQILAKAEEKLTKIREAMMPLVELLDHVKLRYDTIKELEQQALTGGTQQGKAQGAPAAGPRHVKSVHLPELSVFEGVKRPKVRLTAIDPKNPPTLDALMKELDAFYNAFNELWKAALCVDLGPEIRIRLDDGGEVQDAGEGPLGAARALRELQRAATRNSIQRRYERLNRVLDAVSHRRETLEQWTTPDGRHKLLRDYLDRHRLTVERFAEILGCQPMTIHNWRKCRGKGLGPKQLRIEEVLRKGLPPARINSSRNS